MGVLYVPFAVEAYVTNGANRLEEEVALVSPNYAIGSILGGSLEPKPFCTKPLYEATGVYLHFILPDALTHATLTRGILEYPVIPNRWIVTRLYTNKDKICAKSWIVESDYLGTDKDKSVTKSVTVPYLHEGKKDYRRLGRCYPIESTPNPPEEVFDHLTAIGAGDSTFAAYYPSCHSVLGFHDNLADVPLGEKGLTGITYFVMGYYACPAQDPLNPLTNLKEDEQKKVFEQYLCQNNWEIIKQTAVPTEVVFHGMIHSLPWQGPTHNYLSNKTIDLVHVALGNTSVEALSALISSQFQKKRVNTASKLSEEGTKSMERFLTALQYDVLDELIAADGCSAIDGIPKAEDLIHEKEFDPSNGGTLWHIRLKDNLSKAEKPSIPNQTGKLLSDLNTVQLNADRLAREHEWLQNAIFSAWYICINSLENTSELRKPKGYDEKIGHMMEKIGALCALFEGHLTKEEQARRAVDEAKKAVEANIAIAQESLKLESIKNGLFYRPKDPVILLGGPGIKRPYAYGHDGVLHCREHLINKLVFSGEASLNKDEILAYCRYENFNINSLSPSFSDLLCEAICLSPELTNWIAQKRGTPAIIPVPSEVLPPKFASCEWEPPWITLFLEWKVKYTPTKTSKESDDNSLANWCFCEIDYQHDNMPQGKSHEYLGRTVLTPHATKLLRQALQQKIAQYKTENASEETETGFEGLLDSVQNLSVVSQQLSGFRLQLLSKRAALQLPILNHSKFAPELVDRVAKCIDGVALNSVEDSEFFPIRAGFLNVLQINVVNSFGLIQTLKSDLDEVIFSDQFAHLVLKNSAMLPPRFSQGARLCFDWISCRDDTIVSSIDPDDSPICGYLYPDLLNHNLMMYDYDGTYKGMLKLVYRKSRPKVQWIGCEFNKSAHRGTHLEKFLESLIASDVEDPAFAGLMGVIDARLEASCAFTEGDALSVLWGRPLVLARARLLFELEGPPAYSQKEVDIYTQPTHNFEKNELPVFIGDISRSLDGTIGYFPDGADQYSAMHCVCNADSTCALKTRYLKYDSPIKVPVRDVDRSFAGVYLTVLMEASGRLSLRTGVLPAQQVQIAAEHIDAMLSRLQAEFEINPILSQPSVIALPLSKENYVKWTWRHLETDSQEVVELQPVFQGEAPILIDGYLKREEQKHEKL
ncbi:MAG: hypothetical protein LBH74_09455 [Nitrososphaerota archaeon]|jgi:hypothetical protein|nr:hypothetical protein [Nitrososphaerota archaeon]